MKEKEIVPYHPLPYRPGNKVVRTYVKHMKTKSGFEADITYADFRDKKNKLNEGFVLYVKWRK